MTRAFLELLRIIAIIIIFGGGSLILISKLYEFLGVSLAAPEGGWLLESAILICIFVLYRNRLQFSGFYRRKEHKKLSGKLSLALLLITLLLFVAAPIV
ncbi:hypothetical protein [Falsibacillus albus]|uniref:Uncharacterized protein n=1 Tax=Falsibacillus albus TaxID=2478915 RepID=A0A3L7K0S3_9BACI|nr:hypothetical protein [Falsibacillus albus]RLQ94242.1 hypothetical protein D9X91_14345 [Falsibacillus albus]